MRGKLDIFLSNVGLEMASDSVPDERPTLSSLLRRTLNTANPSMSVIELSTARFSAIVFLSIHGNRPKLLRFNRCPVHASPLTSPV
jgi:hypothetical protein